MIGSAHVSFFFPFSFHGLVHLMNIGLSWVAYSGQWNVGEESYHFGAKANFHLPISTSYLHHEKGVLLIAVRPYINGL